MSESKPESRPVFGRIIIDNHGDRVRVSSSADDAHFDTQFCPICPRTDPHNAAYSDTDYLCPHIDACGAAVTDDSANPTATGNGEARDGNDG
ncbi:MAG: hypothetical protein DLM70_18350, partial [Chloroflexi bacterium]